MDFYVMDKNERIVSGPYKSKLAAEQNMRVFNHKNRQGLRIEVEPEPDLVAFVDEQLAKAYKELGFTYE